MMEKIINTMFHGSGKAKLFLWSVFVMILATILLAVLAAVTGSAVFWAGAVVAGIASFITSQSVSLTELNRKKKPVPAEKKQGAGKKKTSKQRALTEGDSSPAPKEKEEEAAQEPMAHKEREHAKARYLAAMDAKKMKSLLKHHKVYQKHIFAMIDSYPEEQISQTPAVLWQTSTHLHILAIDHNPREFQVLLENIRGIHYQKDVEADAEMDYATFQYANYISKLYKPYLPSYREITQDGELLYVKNLFMIDPGISFTNTSMKGLMEILPKKPLLIDDPISRSNMVNEYFKEVYRYSILCKNGVYTLDEYKEKLEGSLDELLDAPVTRKEFSKTLQDMKRYHLITSDHVAKYTQLYLARESAATEQ